MIHAERYTLGNQITYLTKGLSKAMMKGFNV